MFIVQTDEFYSTLTTLYMNDIGQSLTAYRTDEGAPWVLPVVRTVESQMSSDETLDHEYLAIDGLRSYTDAAARLLLGEDSVAITENRVHTNDVTVTIVTFS